MTIPEKTSFNGRTNIFSQTTIFAVGEIVLFNDHDFRFAIDAARNIVVKTFYTPRDTTAIIHSGISSQKQIETHYYVTPAVFYTSTVFATDFLPAPLLHVTDGKAKLQYVELSNPAQQWYTFVFLQLPSPVNQNALTKLVYKENI